MGVLNEMELGRASLLEGGHPHDEKRKNHQPEQDKVRRKVEGPCKVRKG